MKLGRGLGWRRRAGVLPASACQERQHRQQLCSSQGHPQERGRDAVTAVSLAPGAAAAARMLPCSPGLSRQGLDVASLAFCLPLTYPAPPQLCGPTD